MSRPLVLFVDGTCPSPYDPLTPTLSGLGGTEASVLKIAEGLASLDLFDVFVEQHNRTDNAKFKAIYCKPETVRRADYVISLRYPQLISLMQERFKNAKHYLWNHDLCVPNTADLMVTLRNFKSLAVSSYHRTQLIEALKPSGYTGQFPIKVVYNPIDDALTPDETRINKDQLIWTSSPHKGLDHALDLFAGLRRFNGKFELIVCNPGYLPLVEREQAGVVVKGAIPHSEVISLVRSSLCLFYPNCVFPETFGIVLAEANAVGTPVITHPLGATQEVLYHPYETVDCRNPKLVIDRVMSWYEGDRPKVKAKKEFRLTNVLKAWMRLFDES